MPTVQVGDQDFLRAVLAETDAPGSDIAVTHLAEIAPGMLAAREEDGECVVYVNLDRYTLGPEHTEAHSLNERNMPYPIGTLEDVTSRCIADIMMRAWDVIVLLDGTEPAYYNQPVWIRGIDV